MMKRLAYLTILSVLLRSDPGACAAPSASMVDQEYEIKAAYLYNFTKFVQWPARQKDEPARLFIIGVLGKDPFGSLLESSVSGKIAAGRRIEIVRYPDIAALRRSARPADMLFVALGRDSLAAALECVKGRPVLTIGETEGFCEQGGMINFVIHKNRVRFEINAPAARVAALRVSSKLLQLAASAGAER